jgi:hypothetical protein
VNSKVIIKGLYALNGILFFVVGSIVLLYKTPLLPDGIHDIILREAHNDLNAVHLTQEFSSLMIAMGIMAFWAVKNYDNSKVFHIGVTIFWGLLALIHWFDARGPWQHITGPIINTIPFILYLLAGWARMA